MYGRRPTEREIAASASTSPAGAAFSSAACTIGDLFVVGITGERRAAESLRERVRRFGANRWRVVAQKRDEIGDDIATLEPAVRADSGNLNIEPSALRRLNQNAQVARLACPSVFNREYLSMLWIDAPGR